METKSKSNRRSVALVRVDKGVLMNEPPLGILFIAHALRRHGFIPIVYHINERQIKDAVHDIVRQQPLFVGFSVITGLSLDATIQASKAIKTSSSMPIVWGNCHATLLARQCLTESYVDIVCLGEGEETCVDLARSLSMDSTINDIAGIAYKDKDDKIYFNEKRPLIKSLDLCEPDWSTVDLDQYVVPSLGFSRVMRVLLSRGCPHRCNFCVNYLMGGRKWRVTSIKESLRRLDLLKKKAKLEALYFSDENMFTNPSWAWPILEGIKLPFFLKLRTEYINEPLLKHLVDCGCRAISLGFESGSDRVLKEIVNKGSTVEDHLKAAKVLAKFPDVLVKASFIVGFPGETKDEYLQTVKFICDLLYIIDNVTIVISNYVPYPATPLFERAVTAGFVPPTRTEDWHCFERNTKTMPTPWIDWNSPQQTEKFYEAVEVLAAVRKIGVPILARLIRFSILKGHYNSFLIRLLDVFRKRYAFGPSNHYSTRILRRLIRPFLSAKDLQGPRFRGRKQSFI